MTEPHDLTSDVHLDDPPGTVQELVEMLQIASKTFRRTRAIVALSGGIDSSVSLGLASRALGPDRVLALTLPDQESDRETVNLAQEVADKFGVVLHRRDITPVLTALRCYEDRLEVVRRYVADFDPAAGDTFSVEFDSAVGQTDRLQSFHLNVIRASTVARHRLSGRDFLTIMAATNQKQRVRMLMTYRFADEYNLMVVGTSNRLELDQGFFVKHGDGSGDVFPLRNLLKTQVYDIAQVLEVPESVRRRPPTTDTFSAAQSQEDYFYGASIQRGDALFLGYTYGIPAVDVAAQLDLTEADVAKFYALYTRRAAYAAYLKESV